MARTNTLSERSKGVLITTAGVLAISPDALLVRLIGADDWTTLFWRGLLSGTTIFLALLILHRGKFVAQVRAVGRTGLWFALLFGGGTILFVFSINETTVANTLFVVSTAPLFAAIMSRVFLGESVALRTWIAILCALVGIAVIASGSFGSGGGSLLGDLAALGAAISIAGTFTMARKRRVVSMVPAMALASFVTALAVLPFAQPFEVAPGDPLYIGLMGFLVIPLGFGLMTLGPRYLPAPEVSLLLLLESLLGPLFVWLVLGENPGPAALIGGAIVLTTLAALNLSSLRAQPAAS